MHVATPLDPDNVHVPNDPVPLDDRVIVPVGVNSGEGDVSVTVTVQLVVFHTTIVVG